MSSAQEHRTTIGNEKAGKEKGKRKKLDEALAAAQAVLRGTHNGGSGQIERRASDPPRPPTSA
jgi:hypothetical protein